MSIESQTQQHVPFRLEAKVIALALELAWMDDRVRSAFPPENREVLLSIREKWNSIADASVNGSEGSE